MTEDGTEFIATPVKRITAAQLQALKDAQDLLPPELDSLSPLLADMLATYEATVPPHRRPIKVRVKIDTKDASFFFLLYIYSLSVFKLKIMTLYNNANIFPFLSLIPSFRCPFESTRLYKSFQNQNDLTSSKSLNVRFLLVFLFVFFIYVAQNPFSCDDFDVDQEYSQIFIKDATVDAIHRLTMLPTSRAPEKLVACLLR
jgi:hypothetical protein